MANITNEQESLVRRILEGDGRAPLAQRRAAFDNSGLTGPLRTLTEKVAKHAYKITDEDIAAARSSGLTEDQIFELAVCAAVGQATRQNETAVAALEAATGGTLHASRHPR
jgi:alkylhydroperoxidase family enzyme